MDYDEMMVKHQALIDSQNYLSEFLSDLHFNPMHTINNCTHLVNDSCYKDLTKEGYFSACGETKCENSPFCACIRQFRNRYVDKVRKIFGK